MSSKFDPLEEAKVSSDKSESKDKAWFGRDKKNKKKKSEAQAEAKAPEESKPVAQPEPEPEEEIDVAFEEESEPVKTETKKAPKSTDAFPKFWRVTKEKTIGWNKNIITFKVGTVLATAGYGGQAGIEKLKRSGVGLEPA